MLSAIWWGGLAAGSLLIGYLLANRGLSNRTIGMIMGIGAGALISAIAYELVPESVLVGRGMALAFASGALAFFVGDWLVDHRGGADRKDITGGQTGSGAAIFIGTLLDNVPESLILGIGLALGGAVNVAFITAVFISNLPEGVAGTVNLAAAGYSRQHIFWMWALLVFVSAASAGFGYLLINRRPELDGLYAQAFAAGAMLTMLADAMMPEAFEHGGKLVGLFTVMGFLAAAMLSVAQ
ncbi:MAG TPA: ZIP family zinc transporter [Chloroflexota bacterium]|nr:ZIP family zinc transporter [Chloroflexota bacterium]HUM69007.1 ZIP family zinc transporter [Chloroflexota bacterium]